MVVGRWRVVEGGVKSRSRMDLNGMQVRGKKGCDCDGLELVLDEDG